MFPFFTGNEVEKYFYYKVPQLLFTDEKFLKLSCEAKLLYGILLDRCNLSKKNKWFDEDGKIYVFFKQNEACEKLGFGKNKAVRIFDELENIGLILRKKQGQGKPAKIYVCNFSGENSLPNEQTSLCFDNKEVKTPQNRESGLDDIKKEVQNPQNGESKFSKIGSLASYYINQPEMNNNLSINQLSTKKQTSESDGWTDGQQTEFEEDVKEQIEYDVLLSQGIEQSTLDLIVDIIVEAYNPQTKPLKINGQLVSPQNVMRQYGKLNSEHIGYVLDNIAEISSKKRIMDLRGYLRTSLYNAPHTMELHYSNEVNYDFAQKN